MHILKANPCQSPIASTVQMEPAREPDPGPTMEPEHEPLPRHVVVRRVWFSLAFRIWQLNAIRTTAGWSAAFCRPYARLREQGHGGG